MESFQILAHVFLSLYDGIGSRSTWMTDHSIQLCLFLHLSEDRTIGTALLPDPVQVCVLPYRVVTSDR